MNLNHLARYIAKKEKGKKQVDIAQIKEIMKILLKRLAITEPLELFKVLKKYK